MSHTTLSIDKTIYNKSARRAKKQHLTVSAIARMLLDAYAEGKIDIMAVQMVGPVEFRELPMEEITPAIQKKADKMYKAKKPQLINIPV